MKKLSFILFVSLLCITLPVFAQEQAVTKFRLRGVIRDQNSVVIAGLPLKINRQFSGLTDINGEFQISLSDGDYILTTDLLPPNKFRAFIKISDKGINPNYLEFVIDSNAIICSENLLPKLISAPVPTYPPAARAINAIGEVAVEVKIAQNGDVLSTTVKRGHPLLRAASQFAAGKFKFEPSQAVAERVVELVFVFLPMQTKKPGLSPYQCPYRILVTSIDIISTRTH